MEAFDKTKVQLQTAVRFEQFVEPSSDKEVVDAHNFSIGPWREIGKFTGTKPGIEKFVIPVNIKEYCMMVVAEVAPGTKVPKHAHDEGIVRYIMQGSLTQNGVKYGVGDWVFVPEGVPYEIDTPTGYIAMCLYRTWCKEPD
jgi:quercetin dioxygenase-like cupin family protein